MSGTATATTQTQTRNSNQNGAPRGRRMNRRGGGRGGSAGGRGGRGGRPNNTISTKEEDGKPEVSGEGNMMENVEENEVKTAAAVEEVDDSRICWICAEPVKYFSVSECNHRTCHVCALRLRALYKKLDCTFCKVCFSILHSRDV